MSICANFSFNFLEKVVRDQRWPITPLFVVNISPSFGEFTAPLHHILPVHNITTNSNTMLVNFHWMFTFCLETSNDRLHLTSGRTLDRHCHFKQVSLKQSRFYQNQMSMTPRQMMKVDGSLAIISIKSFPNGLHMMHLYFPDMPRILQYTSDKIL